MHEEYTPYELVLITHKITQVIASPIKRVSLTDENKNSENIIQHNNYTYLKVIGEKLDQIEQQINLAIIKNIDNNKEKPFFYTTQNSLSFTILSKKKR